jgi:hypothetical protein
VIADNRNRNGLAWTELRDAAADAVARGWPVVPGTYGLGIEGRWFGREGASELGPIEDGWAQAPVTDRDQAQELWTNRPYGVLLVCGRGVDVLELPARLAQDALPALAGPGLAGPVAVAHPARWLLFVASGAGLLPKLAAWPLVTYRGAGSWVPLPPTDLGLGRAAWHRAPDGQRLPESQTVQHMVITALGAGRS